MAAKTAQIMCINKTNRQDAHARIQNVGGVIQGERWVITEDEAIANIDADEWNFYTAVQGESVWVIVAEHNGYRYLKTKPDGFVPDNLLSLPECPAFP